MKNVLLLISLILYALNIGAQSNKALSPLREKSKAFYTTEEARRIGDQVLLYQRTTGGWPKNIDMARPLSDEDRQRVERDKERLDDSTIDNNATTTQLAYLARLYQGTKDKRYRDAFRRGVEFLLSGQYDNGGWPQFWPKNRDYQIHITYNDGAMVNTMNMLRDIAEQREPYGNSLTDKAMRKRATRAWSAYSTPR